MRDEFLLALVFAALLGIWVADTILNLGFKEPTRGDTDVSFAEAKPIFEKRCVSCHSQPHWNWTNYDVAYAKRDQIKNRVWNLRNMPLGAGMPEEERKVIKDWVDSGAKK
jgi:uncharacterized membrane protein